MQFLQFLPQVFQLIFAIISEVHTVQAAMGASTGAEKSQAVLDKVTPIAAMVNAETPHVQSIIDGIVAISKAANVGAFKLPAASVDTSGAGSQEAA
jgi:hypothetical protein